jgi:hypothetical protein
VKKRKQGAKIRIVGTNEEILRILAALTCQGFVWKSNEHFYPRIDEPGFYSYYLEDFEPPQKASTTVN